MSETFRSLIGICSYDRRAKRGNDSRQSYRTSWQTSRSREIYLKCRFCLINGLEVLLPVTSAGSEQKRDGRGSTKKTF